MIRRRAPQRWLVVLGALLFSWFAGAWMVAIWRAARIIEDGPPGREMSRPDVPLEPITGLVVMAIVVTIGGLLVAFRWTRTGYAMAVLGSTIYVVLGGGLRGGVVPALAAVTLLLVVRLRVRRAWPLLTAIPVVFLLSGWRDPWLRLDDPRQWGAFASALVWTAVPTLVALLIRGRRESARRGRAEELRQAAVDERLRVARDIHDVVGHSLSMISLQSGVALRVLDANPAQVRASLEAIRSSSRGSLAELRHALGIFRGEADLTPAPSLAGLPTLVEDARRGGVTINFTPADGEGIPDVVQSVAYRVVQEALTNVIRHAPGAPVSLVLTRSHGLLSVRVTDAGGAVERIAEGGGLTGMRERVEAIGGKLTLAPAAMGLTVSAALPWEET